ncbi:MAG: glycosyltransferase family 39 protein [Acidobacteriota bacterium]|nr:glycosyltransferase family 39 protein [Acidobacteriota bacterium]
MKRPALLAICAIALIHAALYIVYQAPDRQAMVNWSDQRGYQRLGESLATTGQFTRYTGTETFTPEVIRTPGYPAFVAVIYKVFGLGNNTAVAVAQASVFAAICLLVFALVKRVWTTQAAVLAAMLTALYSPMPYFGALVVTELWTAFVATAAIVILVRAAQGGALRDFALAGMLLSATTIVRPAFVLMPFFFALAVPVLVRSQRTVPRLKGWAVLTLIAGLTLLPWFTYNYVNLGKFTLSPAGGIGRGLWEGSWQGQWPGRIQAELTALAETTADRDELNRRIAAKASETGLPAGPMLQYVNEWRDVRLIWDTPTDPMERVRARVAADSEYLRYALIHMRADPIGHVQRRVTRGLFILWAAELPIRHDDINAMPWLVIRGIWLIQVVLLLVAAWGAVVLARGGRWLEAVMLTLPIVYVTGVHLPLLCEARQSLPVKPVVLALAAIGLSRGAKLAPQAP